MAKISPRAKRTPMAAAQAARQLFQERGADALAMSLVKSMGGHPPGSLMQLKSGEVAVVIRRPASGLHPLVATFSDARGRPSLQALRRDTAQAAFAIQGAPCTARMPFRGCCPNASAASRRRGGCVCTGLWMPLIERARSPADRRQAPPPRAQPRESNCRIAAATRSGGSTGSTAPGLMASLGMPKTSLLASSCAMVRALPSWRSFMLRAPSPPMLVSMIASTSLPADSAEHPVCLSVCLSAQRERQGAWRPPPREAGR